MVTTPEDNIADVTVNLAGLWLLQAIMGIPTLAPDLVALPYGAARTDDWIGTHPGMAALREQGLVGRDGRVVDGLARRLDILAAPDVDVAIHAGSGPLAPSMPDLADPSTWRSIRRGSCGWCWLGAMVSGCQQCVAATRSPSMTCRAAEPRG